MVGWESRGLLWIPRKKEHVVGSLIEYTPGHLFRVVAIEHDATALGPDEGLPDAPRYYRPDPVAVTIVITLFLFFWAAGDTPHYRVSFGVLVGVALAAWWFWRREHRRG